MPLLVLQVTARTMIQQIAAAAVERAKKESQPLVVVLWMRLYLTKDGMSQGRHFDLVVQESAH
jgi:hypothetical protein